jgi:hypothetical protein
MIQIIDGKRYNTETATEVDDYSNGLGRNDFRCVEETLYLTKKGAWFIRYWGGAMTEYAESCGGNARCGGSGIKPITAEEAYEWLEAHANPELVEAHFADRIQEA